jgi:NADH-ubiquinone oxidoreductase chain 5
LLLGLSSTIGRALYTFFNRKWFFDKVYAEWVAAPILRTAYAGTYQTRDRGLLELLGPRGVATAILSGSNTVTNFSLGFVFRTLLLLLLAIALLLARVGGWSAIAPRVDRGCLLRIIAALAIAIALSH